MNIDKIKAIRNPIRARSCPLGPRKKLIPLVLIGMLWVIAAACPLPCSAAALTPQQRYDQVRAAVEKKDFPHAQELADAMLTDGLFSPQLFQLLGHIRYREEDHGRAALWYQRASLFPPPVPEIRQNLAHIHDLTGNVRFRSNTFRDQFSARFSRTQWAHAAVVSGWIALFSLTVFALIRSAALRTLMMLICVLATLSATLATLAWTWRPSYQKIENLAIVTEAGVRAYTAATTASGSVSSLPPGSEVRKLGERGKWSYVEIPSRQTSASDKDVDNIPLRGWVPNRVLTLCWPFDPGYLE
jgi:hypothetical protein